MTPEEAIAAMDEAWTNSKPLTLGLLEAIKATETRRCADYVRSQRITDGKVADIKLARIADDLLRAGGLEAVE